MSLLLWILLLLPGLVCCNIHQGRKRYRSLQEKTDTQELVFAVTYRDFLPATCSFNINFIFSEKSSIEQLELDAWNTSTPPLRPETCNKYSFFAATPEVANIVEINRQLAEGEISGHPDFEALNQAEASIQCSDGFVAGVDFPVSSCIFLPPDENGTIVKDPFLSIIKDELFVGTNGLAKPVYCSDKDGENTRCGFVRGTGKQAQTQKVFFDTWFNDDLKFNKRIGQPLVLKPLENETGIFVFNANTDNDSPAGDDLDLLHFGPLDLFTAGNDPIVKLENTIDIVDAPAWPRSITDNLNAPDPTINRSYYFTTELHTTFVFNRSQSMVFSFEGDDDFWAFINNKLVIDLGGVHESFFAEVDLNGRLTEDLDIAGYLGLVDGEVATLDIFHAERQTSQSFFTITTSLSPACNVQQSGTVAVDLITSSNDISLFTLSNTVFSRVVNDVTEIIVQEEGKPFSSGYFFTTIAENVGRGFEASFEVSVKGQTEGFAFVVQNQGILDYPLSSGSTFGFQDVSKSFAIVFDLCADRTTIGSNETCNLQTVSVHHPENSTEGNFFGLETRRTFDSIARRLSRNEYFSIDIIHYGGQPNFLEVYVNGSLYLRENDFDLISILDGTGAHSGITATASGVSAEVKVRNFLLKTVEVVPDASEFVGNLSEVQQVEANGNDLSEGFQIVTRDFCENQLESGTLGSLFDAKYFEVLDSDSPRSRKLQEGEAPVVQDAVIVDNDDGSYNIALQTEVATSFALAVAFGEGCELIFSEQNEAIFIEVNDTLDSGSCFFNLVNDAAIVAISTPPVENNPNETFVPDDDGNSLPVLAVAITGSICFLCVLLVLAAFLRKRRIWEGLKVYVPTGQLFKTELDTRFDNQNEYNSTGMQVLHTQQQILDLQSHTGLTERHKEILELKQENKTMKEMIRASKVKAAAEEVASDNELDSFEDEEEEDLPPAPVLSKAAKNEF